MTSIYKYHGLGNDFVLVERPTPALPSEQVRAMCDRHCGVGADGVLVSSPPEAEASDARMTLYNRDGSRPEMCGNGIRCVVRHLVERRSAGDDKEWTIETDAGPRTCRVVSEAPDDWRVAVDMGRGELQRRGLVFDVADTRREFDAVDMGNPHAVTFEPVAGEVVDAFGAHLNDSEEETFSEGVNVEFVDQRSATRLDVVVYERGVGRTRACGTGACAAAVAAWESGRVDADREIDVHLPGGVLQVRRADDGDVWMTGPVVAVFEGEWLLE